jgi:hypothetical protein
MVGGGTGATSVEGNWILEMFEPSYDHRKESDISVFHYTRVVLLVSPY